MSLTLQSFAAPQKDYVARLNNNNTAIKAAVEALQAQVLASSGAGSQLLLDIIDRAGVLGADSYVLDIDGYDGSDSIDVGTAGVTSKAWGDFSGSFDRVTLSGGSSPATVSAAAIVSALPKTIYMVVPANGTPQFTELDNVPNVVYLYSMTWDGISLTEFKRLATLLPGYSLIEDIASRAEIIWIYDTETDWISDEQGMSSVLLPGANSDNDLADMNYEVLGFVVNCTRTDEDGMYASQDDEDDADRNHVKWKVTSEGEDWTSEDFDFDCSDMPDFQFIAVAEGLVASTFITEARTFELERTYLGDLVESARAFQWGIVVRRIYGPAMPLDRDFVNGI